MKHCDYGKSSEKYLNAKEVLNKIEMEGCKRFLDAGCGNGFISIEVAKKLGKNGEVYAVDIHEPSIKKVREKIKNLNIKVKAILADITKKIPIEENSVDIYFMANVLHGIVANEKTDELMKEINRVLKPKGKLIIVDFRVDKPAGPPENLKISEEKCVEILNSYGFKIENIDKVGKYHYIVTARKLQREGKT